MSAFDGVYILLIGFTLIVFALLGAVLYAAMWPKLTANVNPGASSQLNLINTSVTSTQSFFNNDFAAILILMFLGSVILALFAYSHPVFLMAWFIFNLVAVLFWWLLNNILTQFVTLLASMNPGTMSTAITFFTGPLPLVIIVFNILVAIVLMGKRMQADMQPGAV